MICREIDSLPSKLVSAFLAVRKKLYHSFQRSGVVLRQIGTCPMAPDFFNSSGTPRGPSRKVSGDALNRSLSGQDLHPALPNRVESTQPLGSRRLNFQEHFLVQQSHQQTLNLNRENRQYQQHDPLQHSHSQNLISRHFGEDLQYFNPKSSGSGQNSEDDEDNNVAQNSGNSGHDHNSQDDKLKDTKESCFMNIDRVLGMSKP